MEHETEFHYHLMPDYAKQDYAGEIIQAMTQWAFGNPDVIFIKTEIELEHIEDKQVLEKCGFQLEGEGQKGPSFVLESTMTNWMTLYMLLGICIGMTFGNLYHNIAIGLSLGLCIGMALGSLTDYSTKKERNKLRENRAGKKGQN